MMKYLYSILIVLFAAYTFIGCSDDDEPDSSSTSTLEMNGVPINLWVNGADVIIHNDGVYIQGKISRTDDDIRNNTLTINIGEDVTDRFSILLEYNHGDGYVTGWGRDNNAVSTYLSGNVKVKSIDKTKHILTLEFKNLTYDSTDDDDMSVDEIVLTGTLAIPYKVIVE